MSYDLEYKCPKAIANHKIIQIALEKEAIPSLFGNGVLA